MEDKILKEVMQIRQLLSELIGTADLPPSEKFSKEKIAKAAKEFQKLAIQRGEWIQTNDIDTVIKNAPWNCGNFIIEKFGFTNYFRRGKTLFFNKKDLIALNKELKDKNINLEKYIELAGDQAKFEKYVNEINFPKGTKSKKHFKIPVDLRDIVSKPYSSATEDLVRTEIKTLMEEFVKFDLSEYIDFYNEKRYAMLKYDYRLNRYIKPEIKKFCKDWAFKFNYANNALGKILELKKLEEQK